jgi:hypothetical protein
LKTAAGRFDRTASSIYQSDWIKRPLAKSPSSPQYGPYYDASWELLQTPDVDAEHQIVLKLSSTPHTPDKMHLADRIQGVEVTARYYPARGWGACVRYYIAAKQALPHGFFELHFVHIQQPRRPHLMRGWDLSLPFGCCEAEIRNGDCTYVFRVGLLEATGEHSALFEPITLVDKRLRACLASAEAFRDSALDELDALETKTRKDVESGAAWIRVVDRSSPRERGPRPGESLPADLKTEALDGLLREVERKRALIQDHYQAIYESAQRAFPLCECIGTGKAEEQDSSVPQNGNKPN